jgi:hypothetical protein
LDDGGESSTYTKNVTWQVQISNDYVGNVYCFGIRTESIRMDAYPINIDFVFEREGEFEEETVEYPSVEPVENFKTAADVSGTYVSFASQNKVTTSSSSYYLLDASKVKFNPTDGYYHMYNERTGYGATLYAKINVDFEAMSTDSGKGFLDELVNLRVNGKNYTNFIKAYSNYVNSDGAYPLTEELKVFLQEFAISQRMFSDGNGTAELFYNYQSSEANQWLYGCGLYI